MSGKTKRKGKRERGKEKREKGKRKGKKKKEKKEEKNRGCEGGGLKYGVCVACGAHVVRRQPSENYRSVFV